MNQCTLMLKTSPMTALNLKSGWSHLWVPFFSIRPLDFHFWWPCLTTISNTSPGHSLANPAIPEKTNLIYNHAKTCKESVLKMSLN